MTERDSHLTIQQVAKDLQMSTDGVYKLIRRGKLKAVRISERKTYVSRLALDAYGRRLNGEGPDTRRPRSSLSVADLRQEFEQETGYVPEDWVAEWKRDRIEDSAENAQLLVRALALRPAPAATRATTTQRGRRPRKGTPASPDRTRASGRKAKTGAQGKRGKKPASV